MRVASYGRFLFFALVLVALSAASYAQVGIGISVNFAPPALPVYEQPPCPAEGYIWTPGYWAWDADDADYYWVPGTWVLAPEVGFLWTPAWWGWSGGAYLFHVGYWGPHVGFYGGVVYGFGYFGHGYEGGRWDGGHFFYNRSVNNINVTNIHNVYNTTIVNSTTVNRVSYNGGAGGINARATPEEEAAERDRHLPPAPVQRQHEQTARSNPQQRASVNQGKPPVAATAKPTDFKGAVPAREAGAPYHPPAERGGTPAARNEPAGRPESAPRPENEAHPENAGRPENNVPRPPAGHAKDLESHQPATVPSTGNASRDQKYQQQQAKLAQKQNQEHQKLQQKQEQEHQRTAQNTANAARTQQLEQKHQQQTQQLEQKHTQQQQHLQQKQQPPHPKEK